MTASPTKRGWVHLRQRGTSALVLSRADANAAAAEAVPGPEAPPPAEPAPRRWTVVLTWVLLGGAVAALWALLLLGDSLSVGR